MNRKHRKKAKLQARGTYHRSNQWKIDRARKGVIRAAHSLARHLGITGEQLLSDIGFESA